MITISVLADEVSPDIETQIDVLESLGIGTIELRTVEGENVIDLKDGELTKLKQQLKAHCFQVSAIASRVGRNWITEPFAPHIEDLFRTIQVAKFFDTPYIRIFSFIIPVGEDPLQYRDEVIRRLQFLTQIAEREGVTLLLENDSFMYANTGERARDLLEAIHSPNLRYLFDPANFVQSGVLPMTDAYSLVEPYLSYIHMKDARMDTGEVVPPGEGDGEIRKLLKTLKEKNYSGFVSIEPRGRPGEADLNFFLKAVNALNSLFAEVGLQWGESQDLHAQKQGQAKENAKKLYELSQPSPTPTGQSSVPVHSWIPITPLEDMEQADYDVLIIGSGAGGGAALWRLCDRWRNNGKKVGMIEAGDLLVPTNLFNLALFSAGRALEYISRITTPTGNWLPEFSGAKQIFALGGRTIQWAAVTPRMPPYLLSKWPVPKKEMDYYYHIAEQVMNVNKVFANSSLIMSNILDVLRKNGLTDAIPLPMAIDLNPTQHGEIHSNAYFSSILFLAKALNQKAFDLAINARAVQLYIENGKATGVKVMSPDLKSYYIKAKTIIVSGSTLETPRLLLYSGVPGPAIGHYLLDHSAVSALGAVDQKKLPDDLGLLGVLIPNRRDRPYQIEMGIDSNLFEDQLGTVINGYGSVEPQYENRVSLSPTLKDKFGVPMIDVNFRYSNKDQAVLQQMINGMEKLLPTLYWVEGQPAITLRPPGDDNHEAGTCRIGHNPLTSAANPYGQIHGISGLYVADNSVLPSLGTNPTLSTIALAIRTADYIMHQLK
ncbi:TIM barrel protein [Salipaludibacillus sp. CF4.18]|uniref:TIM barrel protein n=1 Tax=Salipaludibacillus sp. CF4.18 TaxID=3373081 RepID=UPI003EE64B31